MAGFSVITYKEQEIVFYDYSGLKKEDEMIEVMNDGIEYSKKVDQSKKYLILTDISNAFATPGFTEANTELQKEFGHLIGRSAVVGISAGKKILLAGVNKIVGDDKAAKPFNTLEEAKEYLIS